MSGERLASTASPGYAARVTAKSVAGFGRPSTNRRSSANLSVPALFLCQNACYGGLRGGTFGCAGVLLGRSTNPAQSAPNPVWSQVVAAPSTNRSYAMSTAQVIPFQFDAHEVRTLLIDDQPWFVASDVAAALQYREAKDMARNLDDDEKGRQIVPTLGGDQELTVINESGLYSAILRSRKAEAKRFKKWVTAEVLPAIRRTGRYDIASATVGTDGLHILHELIGKKIKIVPPASRRQARARLWSLVHTRFNVPRAELIPADQLDTACNFIAAYSLEGEWLPAIAANDTKEQRLEAFAQRVAEYVQQQPGALDGADLHNLQALCQHMIEAHNIFRRYQIYEACRLLGSPAGKEIYGRLTDGAAIAKRLSEGRGE